MNRLKVLFYGLFMVMLFFVSMLGAGTAFAQGTAVLDIDGNGVVDGGTDSLLVERYLYEFRGTNLIKDAVDTAKCTRCTASAIEAYLATLVKESGGGEDTYTNGLGMAFKLIPAGTFIMGSPENEGWRDTDETQHQVTLTQAFYMQTTEVTQGQWKAVMGSNPSYFTACGDNCPVEQVSWDDVQTFITEMNRRGEGTYRLPTEAEWEYAARAGSTTAFYNGGITVSDCGNDPKLSAIGWYCGNSGNITHLAAQKQANSWGLYDMSGNVWEWCSDWYGEYPTGAVTNPTGPSSGSYRVIGAAVGTTTRMAAGQRTATGYAPVNRSNVLGFRLALSSGQ